MFCFVAQVEGLRSTVPLSAYQPPNVTAVRLSEAFANTTGGTLITITGSNFGTFVSFVTVSVDVGRALTAPS